METITSDRVKTDINLGVQSESVDSIDESDWERTHGHPSSQGRMTNILLGDKYETLRR